MQNNQKQKIKNDRMIILGGGIAGLIKAYFNPEAVIITDQIGGQFSSKFQLGPKYLHVDEYSIRFFEELEIKPSIKKIKIGFFYDGKLHSKNTEENRKRYFKKTRSNNDEPYKSTMSANKIEFDSFDIGVDEIVEIIKEKINNKVILERATGIDTKNKKILTKSGELKYDELISTIPLNIFLFLCGESELSKRFKSHPTTFILSSDYKNCPFDDFENYDYVYLSESQHPYHRITNTDKGLVFEFKGDVKYRMIDEKDRVVMKVGQLIHNDININFKDVEFFGRYASWNHSLLTNTLLKHIYNEINSRRNK